MRRVFWDVSDICIICEPCSTRLTQSIFDVERDLQKPAFVRYVDESCLTCSFNRDHTIPRLNSNLVQATAAMSIDETLEKLESAKLSFYWRSFRSSSCTSLTVSLLCFHGSFARRSVVEDTMPPVILMDRNIYRCQKRSLESRGRENIEKKTTEKE